VRARKPSDLGGNPSSGRVGLAVLLATVAAFLLVPVAQAFAGGTFKLNLAGSGSGEVTSGAGSTSTGTPKIECSGPPATGTCENEMPTEGGGNDFDNLLAVAAAGSEVGTIVVEKGTDVTFEAFGPGYTCAGEGQEELEGFFGGWFCSVKGEPAEAGAEATVCFVLEGEGVEGCKEPEGPPLTLNIEEGEGTVVSSPAGIECPSTCTTEEIAEGSVTLTASPAPGYLFKSWKKCDTGGVNGRQCTINLNEAKTVGAKFVKVWNIDASKAGSGLGKIQTSPGGILCLYNCSSAEAAFKEGSVTVKQAAAKHNHFVQWLGDCTGSEPTCVLSATEDHSVEAEFAPDTQYALAFSKTGGGQGSVKSKPSGLLCGYTCSSQSASYYSGEEVLITVKLNKGTTKVTWSTGAGTCTGSSEALESTCTVTMSSAQELVADFS